MDCKLNYPDQSVIRMTSNIKRGPRHNDFDTGPPLRKFDWVGNWAWGPLDLYIGAHFVVPGGPTSGTEKHISASNDHTMC